MGPKAAGLVNANNGGSTPQARRGKKREARVHEYWVRGKRQASMDRVKGERARDEERQNGKELASTQVLYGAVETAIQERQRVQARDEGQRAWHAEVPWRPV